MQFLTGTNTPDGTGGVLYYGDGSGSGASGQYRSLSGTSGTGDADNFSGTDAHDVMFGDGSGGGEGLCVGSGDKLDILGLLTGYTPGTSTLSQWVTVTTGQTAPGTSTTNSTKLVIDIDGMASGTVLQTLWLEGTTLSTTDVSVLKNNAVLVA